MKLPTGSPRSYRDHMQKPPYTIHLSSTEKGGTKVVSLIHALVTTMQVRAFGVGGDRDGAFRRVLYEEAILPIVPITTTDHVCVGKAVIRTLEKWCFDNFLEFLHKLEPIGLILFVGTADRASSNLKFFRIWMALCCMARLSAVQLVPEACGLHQIQRANVSLLDRTRVYKSVKKSFGAAEAAALSALLRR